VKVYLIFYREGEHSSVAWVYLNKEKADNLVEELNKTSELEYWCETRELES
jgi:hypothetical protein